PIPLLFFLRLRRRPCSSLFPYTTLFRSQDVGDAILNYVEHWRPDVRDEHVFLRVNAPFVPLGGSSAVSSLVRRAARRAGLSARRIGAHILRHTAASLMLREGASLQTISHVLRHQSLDTTVIYAKVDVEMLS